MDVAAEEPAPTLVLPVDQAEELFKSTPEARPPVSWVAGLPGGARGGGDPLV